MVRRCAVTFEKTIADYAGLLQPYAEMAEDRATTEPELLPYYDLLIEYDWPDQREHWKRVATADIADLVAWAEDIRRDEADEAEPEEPFKYERAIRLTITLYPDQLRLVEELARKRHRGKRSPAIQEIIDDLIWERAEEKGND